MATSQKKVEANRRNAQSSTGPTTEAGKDRSRLNALTHGLSAISVPLPHENPSEIHEIRASLMRSYQPANIQETLLVENIVSGFLRMQRSGRFESQIMNGQLQAVKRANNRSSAPSPSDDFGIMIAMSEQDFELAWKQLDRYEKRAQSAYYRAIETLRKLQNDRKREPARELKAETDRQRYIARTVVPISPLLATPVASFGNPGIRQTLSRPQPELLAPHPANPLSK